MHCNKCRLCEYRDVVIKSTSKSLHQQDRQRKKTLKPPKNITSIYTCETSWLPQITSLASYSIGASVINSSAQYIQTWFVTYPHFNTSLQTWFREKRKKAIMIRSIHRSTKHQGRPMIWHVSAEMVQISMPNKSHFRKAHQGLSKLTWFLLVRALVSALG